MYQVSKCMSISPLDRRARAGRESIASAAQCRTRRSAAEHTEPGVNMEWGWAIVRAPVGGGVMAPGAPGVAPRASAPASLSAGQSTKKQPSSEKRRDGQDGVGTYRYRWCPYQ